MKLRASLKHMLKACSLAALTLSLLPQALADTYHYTADGADGTIQ